MSERVTYMSGAWGGELSSGGLPQGQLAELDTEHKATPQRVAWARQLFEEATSADFEPHGNRGKLRHKSTGVVYVADESQVLMSADPRRAGIRYFLIVGDRILFLRPRGAGTVTLRSAFRARSSRASCGNPPAAACGLSTGAPATS
jgi:hypothetical protein